MGHIGIDLGKDGAVVHFNDAGVIVAKLKTPLIKSTKAKDVYDVPGMRDLLVSLPEPRFVTIEKAQPMPAMMGGAQANFQRGLSFGLWQGILVGLGISYDVTSPQAWQRVMLAGIKADDTKQAALIAVKRLWPKEDWRKSERSKNADEGFVDAALIGEFGRRNRGNSNSSSQTA